MISLTRMNDVRFVLNAELIKYIERTPDTVITLINGDRVLVRESVDEVVARAINYCRRIRAFKAE
jgi:flagellar protein FlbD